MSDHTLAYPQIPQLCGDTEWLKSWQRRVDGSALSSGARLLAHRCLAPYFARYGEAIFRARRRMAEAIGRNVRTVTRYIAELCRAGFLEARQRPRGGVNDYFAKLPDPITDGPCPGGVDRIVHQSSCLDRDKKTTPPTPRTRGDASGPLFFLLRPRGKASYAYVITSSHKAGGHGARDFTRARGRTEGVSSVSVDLTAPVSWPEREEVPKAERMEPAAAESRCAELGFSRRLALHLAASYTAAELEWLLTETAGRAQYPQSYARRLALELEAGTSGPGIAKPKRQRRPRGRKPVRDRGRSSVDRFNATMRAMGEGPPVPERVIPPLPDGWPAMWAELEPDQRRHVDTIAGLRDPATLERLEAMSESARRANIDARRWDSALVLGVCHE